MTIDEAVAELLSNDTEWERSAELVAGLERWNGDAVTPEQAANAISLIRSAGDSPTLRYLSPGVEHTAADAVLCALLRSLGCGKVVDEYLELGRYFS